ncbi:MAG TPA: LPS assembly protein LptD [Candidatus Sulfotelmatobacter sp.]
MNLRNRFLITAAMLCHLLLACPLVTSQLRSKNSPTLKEKDPPKKEADSESTPCARQARAVDQDSPVICSLSQEKDGSIYKLHQAVEVYYRSYVLRADEATYNADTGEAKAEGHFALDGGPNDDHIRASRGTYNLLTETGSFYDVNGTTGLRFRGSRVILTSTAPFAFTGKVVEKTSPDHYLVFDGTITTCELPHPKWQFNARKVVVDVGGNAKIYRSEFLLHGLPVLYFPFATHPVQREARQSGFLVPSVGRSSVKGNIVGDSFYWAINRSMDADVGVEYYSLRGWSQRGEFRARPSDTSYIDLNYFGVRDRGIGTPPVKQGGENARLNAEGTFYGFRSVANIDYLSSFLFRLAFNEVFSQAVYSEVKSQAFLSRTDKGFSWGGMLERYQNFQSTTAGDVVTISHAPTFDASSVDRQLWRSPFYWSFDSSFAGLSRSEPRTPGGAPGLHTGELARFDVNPEISLPLLFRGWSLRPALSLHDTYYSEQLTSSLVSGLATGSVEDRGINRPALEAAVEIRPPALERVFQKEFLGRKWKHVIEPVATYRLITGVSNFSNYLHFDERDVLADTHEVEYGFVTRLYAKRARPTTEDCAPLMSALTVGGATAGQTIPWQHTSNLQSSKCAPLPEVREIATWEVAQKYFLDPTFGGALIAGQRNVFTSTIDLTGIAFVSEPRHLSPLVSRLKVETSEQTDAEWDMDYDFQFNRVNASTVLANYHSGPFTIGGGDAFLQIPQAGLSPGIATRFNQFRIALGYGQVNKRGLSAASSFGIDAETGLLQFATAQTNYNWDCCGITMEYRRYAIANVRNENLYRFSFTLANIGSFGNLRRQERLY